MAKQPGRKAAKKTPTTRRASRGTAAATDNCLITLRAQDDNQKPINCSILRSAGAAILGHVDAVVLHLPRSLTLGRRSGYARLFRHRSHRRSRQTGGCGRRRPAACAGQAHRNRIARVGKGRDGSGADRRRGLGNSVGIPAQRRHPQRRPLSIAAGDAMPVQRFRGDPDAAPARAGGGERAGPHRR